MIHAPHLIKVKINYPIDSDNIYTALNYIQNLFRILFIKLIKNYI